MIFSFRVRRYQGLRRLETAGFNLERLEAGDPVPVEVADSVMQSTDITGASFIGMSEPGALVYVPGTFQATDRKLYWVNREGRPEPLAVRADSYNRFRLSPDGRQVAIEIDQGVQQQIWIHNMSQPEILRLLSREGAHNQTPTYKSVGQLSYAADGTIVSRSADGSNDPESLVKKQRQIFYPDWCLDGRFLAWDEESSRIDRDVWYVTPEAGDEPRLYVGSEANEQHPRFSPQCDLLAYASDESGRDEIYVQSFPNEGRQQVSSGGVFVDGFAWARRGRQLLYLNGSRMMAVDIETKPSLSVVQTKELFETPFPVSPNFDVGPDGRFLMIRIEERHPREINVDLNWLQDLTQGASTP